MAKTKIADFSHHQGVVDWSRAKDDLALAIIRVQYGTGLVDRQYKSYIAGCKKYGIPFGHYAYALFKDVAGAKAEAKAFLERADDEANFLVVDVEEMTTRNKNDIVPATQAFIDYLHDHGVKKVGLYTGHSFYSEHGMSKVKADFLWIPRYSYNDNGQVHSVKPAIGHDIWQFSQNGRLSGVGGSIDLNVLSGRKPLSYFTSKTTSAPKPDPEPVKKTEPPSKFNKPPKLTGKADYVALMKNYAGIAGKGSNIPPEVCLAQWAWESTWGRSNLAQTGNNFAGIKYTKNADFNNNGWSGYYTIDRFVKDYIRVMNLSYYTAVRNAVSIKATTDALAKSPYSSDDPEYGNNIYEIIRYNKFTDLSFGTTVLKPSVPATPKPPVVEPPKPKPKPVPPKPKPVPPKPKPVPPPPKPVPPVVVVKPVVVKEGDTLGGIAKDNGTTVGEIKKENGMKDTDKVAVGTTIKVPTKKEFKDISGLPSNIYGGIVILASKVNIYDNPDVKSRIRAVTQSGDKYNVFGIKNGLYALSGDTYITADETKVKFTKNPNYRIGEKV